MAELDYTYLDSIVNRALELNSNAFAELYAATCIDIHRIIFEHIKDYDISKEVLKNVYIEIFRDFYMIKDFKDFMKQLNVVTNKLCSDVSVNTSNSSDYFELNDIEASYILSSILNVCDFSAYTIPLNTFWKWKNYLKPGSKKIYRIIYGFMIFLLLLPFLFIKPKISAERINIETAADITYKINVSNIIPIKKLYITLNGKPVDFSKESNGYILKIKENGELSIKAAAFNGQKSCKSLSIKYIDDKKPEFITSYYKDDYLFLVVKDVFSGINYKEISGLKVISYDEDNNLIKFIVPKKKTLITIPDNAGNKLLLSISPHN